MEPIRNDKSGFVSLASGKHFFHNLNSNEYILTLVQNVLRYAQTLLYVYYVF